MIKITKVDIEKSSVHTCNHCLRNTFDNTGDRVKELYNIEIKYNKNSMSIMLCGKCIRIFRNKILALRLD